MSRCRCSHDLKLVIPQSLIRSIAILFLLAFRKVFCPIFLFSESPLINILIMRRPFAFGVRFYSKLRKGHSKVSKNVLGVLSSRIGGNRVGQLKARFSHFRIILHHMVIDLGMPTKATDRLFHSGDFQPFQPLLDLVKQSCPRTTFAAFAPTFLS